MSFREPGVDLDGVGELDHRFPVFRLFGIVLPAFQILLFLYVRVAGAGNGEGEKKSYHDEAEGRTFHSLVTS